MRTGLTALAGFSASGTASGGLIPNARDGPAPVAYEAAVSAAAKGCFRRQIRRMRLPGAAQHEHP